MRGWLRKRSLRLLETPRLRLMLEALRSRSAQRAEWYSREASDWMLEESADAERRASEVAEVLAERAAIAVTPGGTKPCTLCGGRIGPDITGRPMCYGCGPRSMAPRLTNEKTPVPPQGDGREP